MPMTPRPDIEALPCAQLRRPEPAWYPGSCHVYEAPGWPGWFCWGAMDCDRFVVAIGGPFQPCADQATVARLRALLVVAILHLEFGVIPSGDVEADRRRLVDAIWQEIAPKAEAQEPPPATGLIPLADP